jgi:polar amino acid transport system substrate-binding protein
MPAIPMKTLAAILGAAGLLAAPSWLVGAPPVVRADDVAVAATIKNPYEGDPTRAAQGHSLFNQYCAHCHAPHAISPDPPKDLRRLRLRYADSMTAVFYFTVTHGRPDKGMPNWKGVLDDETLWTIFTFLQSVQSQP